MAYTRLGSRRQLCPRNERFEDWAYSCNHGVQSGEHQNHSPGRLTLLSELCICSICQAARDTVIPSDSTLLYRERRPASRSFFSIPRLAIVVRESMPTLRCLMLQRRRHLSQICMARQHVAARSSLATHPNNDDRAHEACLYQRNKIPLSLRCPQIRSLSRMLLQREF